MEYIAESHTSASHARMLKRKDIKSHHNHQFEVTCHGLLTYRVGVKLVKGKGKMTNNFSLCLS